ncbi:carboxylating nicotinate-nucleotide diphosphorylase [Deinococcus peraridilitoris]|uniref:Probable nicotinate-nucleotide pyrophosphorylase [carboxylating] n=1 Tax=Deinococcus peraridilitoris (strain DSM 19664 / LMG 22246 / CIP 109416 / KR-200) TaxID=937777 RepID=L0A3M5_DEIPD|nr:carboxylating nicotinate-nucleotide diphosphorylase [Deinococcus peraridilitoris]AFZ68039.1 nicotinate-nucleotide pyrophosphorylase [Deinococcus peraridilitoris DSM 19664]
MLTLTERLRAALAEDVGRGDATTLGTIPVDQAGHASFLLKQPGLLSGLSAAAQAFTLLDPSVRVCWHVTEGQPLPPGCLIGEVSGPMRALLGAERVALNLLQRMSGIATHTYAHAQALQGTRARLLDTRKTTPLWRDLEKQATRHGGASNHRWGLDDGILIKDNHIEAVGSVAEAVRRARASAYLLKVECEVETLDELREALTAGADRVLLDNMMDTVLAQAVALRDELAPHVTLEASGNMTLERLPRVAQSGVDYISVGALTHSAPSLDISLNVTVNKEHL